MDHNATNPLDEIRGYPPDEIEQLDELRRQAISKGVEGLDYDHARIREKYPLWIVFKKFCDFEKKWPQEHDRYILKPLLRHKTFQQLKDEQEASYQRRLEQTEAEKELMRLRPQLDHLRNEKLTSENTISTINESKRKTEKENDRYHKRVENYKRMVGRLESELEQARIDLGTSDADNRRLTIALNDFGGNEARKNRRYNIYAALIGSAATMVLGLIALAIVKLAPLLF